MRKLLAVVLIIITFVFFNTGFWEDDQYAIYYMNGEIVLGIKIGDSPDFHQRIDHKVIDATSNEKYVIAKQELQGSDNYNYYYIDKIKDDIYLDPDEITKGPFSKKQFVELSKKLDFPLIPDGF